MTLDVQVVTVVPTPTAVVKATTTWPEFAGRWRPMLDAVWAFLADPPSGVAPHGHNVMLYEDDVPNVEVGVQVAGPFEQKGDGVASTLPGGLVATARAASIDTLGDTHDGVTRWSSDHGHRVTGRRWEIYGDPDPATGQFAVDVFWALEEAIP